jgi:hypothetical protein
LPNHLQTLVADDEMDDRVARLKERLRVPDRPVTSKVDPSIVGSEPKRPKPRRVPQGPLEAKHCKGCRAWFKPRKNAQRYCDRCREVRANGKRRPEVEVAPERNGRPAAPPKPQLALPEPVPVVADGPLAERLLARLERAGTRLFTSELVKGLHVSESVAEVEDALFGLVAEGRVECVMSWKVRR